MIATRNRAPELRRTLDRLAELPERPALVVVDNASQDGTPAVLRAEYPAVQVVSLPRNQGASARNIGAARASTPYVAFSDDDSWWAPGSLSRAAAVLDRHPGIGLIAARTLVGPSGEPDPVNAAMRSSPLPSSPLPSGEPLPGPRILGFLACAAVVRRSAFQAAGGFSELLFIGGEEQLLAMDLAAAGWAAVYLDDVVACHWPSAIRDSPARRCLLARNEVVTAWLRRPAGVAAAATLALTLQLGRDAAASRALLSLLSLLPEALRQRRVLPAEVEQQVQVLAGHRRLEQAGA